MLAAIVADCVAAAGVVPPVPTVPEGVEVALRGGLLFVLNHGDTDAELAWTGHDLLTARPTSTGCCGWPPAVPRC